MRNNRNRRAFTFIEMMVVVIIIAMLAVFVAPKAFKRLGKAKANIVIGEIALLASALEDFAIDCDRYPTDEEGLAALVEMPADMAEGKWDSKYAKEKQLMDPWERPYQYLAEGVYNEGSYDIFSVGPDGEAGTEDDIYND